MRFIPPTVKNGGGGAGVAESHWVHTSAGQESYTYNDFTQYAGFLQTYVIYIETYNPATNANHNMMWYMDGTNVVYTVDAEYGDSQVVQTSGGGFIVKVAGVDINVYLEGTTTAPPPPVPEPPVPPPPQSYTGYISSKDGEVKTYSPADFIADAGVTKAYGLRVIIADEFVGRLIYTNFLIDDAGNIVAGDYDVVKDSGTNPWTIDYNEDGSNLVSFTLHQWASMNYTLIGI